MDTILKIILLLLSITFFVGGHILDYSLALFILLFIAYTLIRKKFKFQNNNSLIVLSIFYLWHAVGIIYSTNKGIAYFDLEVKASLIIFPIIFIFTRQTINKFKQIFFKFFFLSSVIFSLFLIIRSIYFYCISLDTTVLFYSKFSYILHPSYYAMYLIAAIICSNLFYKQCSKRNKILIIIGYAILIISIYLSDSKSALVSGLALIIYLLFKLKFMHSKIYLFASLIAIIGLVVFLINTKPRFKMMLNVVGSYKAILDSPNTYKESTGVRILSWNAALELIKENYFLGVGTGDIKPELFKKYEELNYTNNIKIKMNVHNQFIETWLGQGGVGLILLLLIFIIPFIDAIRRKDIILQLFLLLMFLNFLFESMLNTQAGTIFFGLFFGFFTTKD